MIREKIREEFPNLLTSNYSIISPASTEYNCIAWAAQDSKAWWWPDANYQYYWPPEIPRKQSLETFVKAFEILGYTSSDNAEYEEGFEKIAIYVDENGKPTHTSRQLISGRWTSKMGSSEDIEHDFDALSGPKYGSVVTIMKWRKRAGTTII